MLYHELIETSLYSWKILYVVYFYFKQVLNILSYLHSKTCITIQVANTK